MPSSGRKKKLLVFLSHAKEDKSKVRKLCQQLKEDGCDPWLDEERLLPGQDRGLEVEKALHISDVILLCFSKKTVNKEGYVQREYKWAIDIQMEKPEGSIFIIPVRLDNCEIPHFMSDLQWADYPTHYQRLLLSLQSKDNNKAVQKRVKNNKSKFVKISDGTDVINKTKQASHGLTYRQEILSRFFEFIKTGDSFYLIGSASMGKTRLLDFLMRNDVQEYYLGDVSQKTWLVRVDVNRIPTSSNWVFYFYELLLNSILLCCISRKNANDEIAKELVSLDSEVIKSENILVASRFFDLVVGKLCQKYDIKLCFIFDEFDETYRKMPSEVFAQLRAVRDMNRSHVLYGMFLRIPPQKLRPTNENESFYELFSRNAIGIRPYSMTDTLNIIQHLEKNWDIELMPEIREKIASASGGHPGIIKALMGLVKDPIVAKKVEEEDWLIWFSEQDAILQECRKIWLGLETEERLTLLAPYQGKKDIDSSTFLLLTLKGILKGSGIFSPFFEYFLKKGLVSKDTHAHRP